MIDRFRRVANRVSFLRTPSLAVAAVCLVGVVALLLTSQSRASDQWLMPSFVGLLWATALFSFIESFRGVPAKPDASLTFFGRLGQRLKRGWFWLLAIVFVGATLVAFVLTARLVSVWFDEYGG